MVSAVTPVGSTYLVTAGFLLTPGHYTSEGIFTHLKIDKLKIPVILDVTLCHYARAFYLDCLALKVKTVWSFETA